MGGIKEAGRGPGVGVRYRSRFMSETPVTTGRAQTVSRTQLEDSRLLSWACSVVDRSFLCRWPKQGISEDGCAPARSPWGPPRHIQVTLRVGCDPEVVLLAGEQQNEFCDS